MSYSQDRGGSRTAACNLMCVALTALMGCAGYAQIGAGFADNLVKFGGRASGQAQYQVGGGNESNVMANGVLRLRVGGDVQELGAGAGVCLRGAGPVVTPYLRAGLTALQIGAADGRFSVGMFGPYLEGGVAIDIGKMPDFIRRVTSYFIAINAGIGYDVRFTSQPNEATWLFGVALGWRFGVRGR